ncbi:hypothetical protein GCM10022255_115750 [Dactylosporangium darangshiense]|uniref:Uncharacterized protein n=1 Tax=Dactylosporangium darangshiense TaxID=579108 RepID=A0ABP8DW49_9ACTN
MDHRRIRPQADSSTLAAMAKRNKGPSTARLYGIQPWDHPDLVLARAVAARYCQGALEPSPDR